MFALLIICVVIWSSFFSVRRVRSAAIVFTICYALIEAFPQVPLSAEEVKLKKAYAVEDESGLTDIFHYQYFLIDRSCAETEPPQIEAAIQVESLRGNRIRYEFIAGSSDSFFMSAGQHLPRWWTPTNAERTLRFSTNQGEFLFIWCPQEIFIFRAYG